jgi:hypothetical protein
MVVFFCCSRRSPLASERERGGWEEGEGEEPIKERGKVVEVLGKRKRKGVLRGRGREY